jgi:uncharacterized protein YndB with AHSA1/START domain
MRWLLWVVLSLIAIIGVIALIGFFLPVGHEASRSAEFAKPPQAVWTLIADPGSYREWWDGSDVKSVVVESVPPSRLVTKIVDETQFGGTWTLEVSPIASGSRLTITERGEVYNVVFRTLSKYVFGHAGTMESFLAAAKLKLQN